MSEHRQAENRKKVKGASDVELETMLKAERESVHKMRQQLALKQLENPLAVSIAKKNIARILTEIRAREIKAGKGS